MNKIMGFDWAKADKTIEDIKSLLEDYEGEARIQLLERANYFFPIESKRAQYGILDDYRERSSNEILTIIILLLLLKSNRESQE